jgi:hypothetical protein
MSYQDFLATPLSFPAERSPEEPLPEKLYYCRSATFPPTPRSAGIQSGVAARGCAARSAAALQKMAGKRLPSMGSSTDFGLRIGTTIRLAVARKSVAVAG